MSLSTELTTSVNKVQCKLLSTNTYIWMMANRTEINVTEWIGLRAGFSIYSGWVTAATILNATFMLKLFGVEDPDGVLWGLIDEEQMTIAILFIAQIIYNLASYTEMNPLYGSVFIWVITAIRNNVVDNKADLTELKKWTEIIAFI